MLGSCVDPCGTKILSEVPSPDGKNKAVVFVYGCGATTSDSICVAIVPATEKNPRDANVLQAEYREPLTVNWPSNSALIVTGDSDEDVMHKVVVLKGINIVYEAQSASRYTTH